MTDWHAPPGLLNRFGADPSAIDSTTAASLEAHLVSCADCRRTLGEAADPGSITASWDAIAKRIDVPRQHLVLRLLGKIGVSSALARILAATPALQAAGLVAIVAIAAAATVAARTADALGPFLLIAPLAPLATVAAAFASSADPAGEAGVATPLHGAGLVVRRAVAVLGVTFVTLGLAALALPDLGPRAAAWVLPGLALALGALALATWVRIEVAVSILAATWMTVVWTVWLAGDRGPVVDTAAFAAAGQVASAAVAVVAAILVAVRRDRFATLGAFR